jgi:hypothetical protein
MPPIDVARLLAQESWGVDYSGGTSSDLRLVAQSRCLLVIRRTIAFAEAAPSNPRKRRRVGVAPPDFALIAADDSLFWLTGTGPGLFCSRVSDPGIHLFKSRCLFCSKRFCLSGARTR